MIRVRFYEGYDNEVIAELMGYKNEKTLANIKYRGMEKIRNVLCTQTQAA